MKIGIIPWAEYVLHEPDAWLFYTDVKRIYQGTSIEWRMITDYEDWTEVDCFLFVNFYYSWGLPILKKINRLHLRDRIVFWMMESATVVFYHDKKYLPLVKKFTDCIITWNKDLVDDIGLFFSRNLGWESLEKIPNGYKSENFERKHLLCSISGNKQSKHPMELYSERRRVYRHFETNHSEDFDFYGTGWDGERYQNYRGSCKTVAEVYQRYRFALCMENMGGGRGYVTEKIFQCLNCGIVPIYKGGLDIADYVPQECFIPYDRFLTIEEMYQFLKSMDKDRYEKYLSAGREYISARGYYPFTAEAVSQRIIHICDERIRQGKKRTSWFWFAVVGVMRFCHRCIYFIKLKLTTSS